MVGVNGTGKTTADGQARRAGSRREGRKVAARRRRHLSRRRRAAAGAVGRGGSGVPCVKGTPGGDPAAVVFDAIEAARGSRGLDTIIADTAGRLHTQDDLMKELQKVARIAARKSPGAPHETLLVLDGSTGQNAVQQGQGVQGRAPASPACSSRSSTGRRAAGRSWRCARSWACRSASSAWARAPATSRSSSRPGTPGDCLATTVRFRLDAPVQFLKGVGERRAELLARIGIRTARDLLFHIPFRYLDATQITPIARVRDARVGSGRHRRRPRDLDRRHPHPPRAARLPGGAAGRVGPDRMRLARPAVPRARRSPRGSCSSSPGRCATSTASSSSRASSSCSRRRTRSRAASSSRSTG